MKHISIFIAAFLFSILFFEKNIGLNLTIFSIVTTVLLVGYNSKKFKDKTIILHALVYIFTALLVFIQHSSLSIITNCITFFTLVGVVSEQRTSIYVHWLNGIYTTVAGYFHRTFESNTDAKKVNWKKDIDVLHVAKLIGIPLVFILVFIMLYKNGNPMFNNLVSRIDFSFINFQWLLFTVLGYYLFNNISKPVQVDPATSTDLKTQSTLFKSGTFSEEKLKKEKQLGTVLLGFLNLLIVVYIITDIIYVITGETISASAFSSQVHSGINTLIASIIIAIMIILYFFRGNLNFYAENRALKNLSFLWIFLNVMLIVLIAIKNQNYITAFGLTYKRIGVHIYILLTFIGLITTWIKVLKVKNLAFLFRRNTQIAFIVLLVCSTINWDYTITKYNLNVAKSFDIGYLINLTNRNAILLNKKKDDINISSADKHRIETKYSKHMMALAERDWQEWNYEMFENETKFNSTE
ncbi:hypothetical protein A9Q86_12240 [Flavobacteriales bacterium 33_180_T64]|nr:hypothetical protein A9Q86_12240 [Flavobacteriales bacterium 33_180_T64]